MQRTVLITGAGGEIGHSLIEELSKTNAHIIAVDLRPLDDHISRHCHEVLTGDITDEYLLKTIADKDLTEIYHLAALLSTTAEKNPELAHKVNVNGTLRLLQIAQSIGKRLKTAVKFLFPSTIAVYGIKSLKEKDYSGKVKETEYLLPQTMYGVNKLYCEQLGRYFSDNYMRLAPEKESGYVDFRALRFPGLISAFTVPTGGTSDYAPEMIHAAAQGKEYNCFVRETAQIPFMAMPDAIDALLKLAAAPLENLQQRSYNIGAFAPTAEEIYQLVLKAFPGAKVTFSPDVNRQGIVDTW
ncbi:MAG TPA: NAD-dependent epimerase/dehydratase family protein, partial [Patescibacteria group bacterium]|nr:NAD-dependent epimerase/dehydratase family protein [Patescibacteria group bacterium]